MRAACFAIRSRRTLLTAALFAQAGAGCQHDRGKNSDANVSQEPPAPMEMNWEQQQIRGPAVSATGKPVAVQQGAMPLAYLSDMPASIRVVDNSSGDTLAEATVRPRTIVRVDERTGVVFGLVTLIPGPLPRDHEYTIYVVPDDQNVSRTGRTMPRPSDSGNQK
jgi:hypothetical protein